MLANGSYTAYNFMTGHHGVNGEAPVVVDKMDIGMAYFAIQNVDEHIMRSRSLLSKLYGSIVDAAAGAA